MNTVLEVANVEKYYGNKGNLTKALDKISFQVEEGEFVGIMGASGSGKTTLLNCLSTIDRITSGKIVVDDVDITRLKGCLLYTSRQVLCITHLPQIASQANAHYLIEKNVENMETSTRIRELSYHDSVEELARMLGGAKITDAVLQNAREMKDLAQQQKNTRVK